MKPKKKTPKATGIPELKAKELKADKAEAVRGGKANWSGPGDEGPEESIAKPSGIRKT